MKKLLVIFMVAIALVLVGCTDIAGLQSSLDALNDKVSNLENGGSNDKIEEITGLQITFDATGIKDAGVLDLTNEDYAVVLEAILAAGGLKEAIGNVFEDYDGSSEVTRNLFVSESAVNKVLALSGTTVDIKDETATPAFTYKMKYTVSLTDMEGGNTSSTTDDAGFDGGKRIDIEVTARDTETFDQVVFEYSDAFYPTGVEADFEVIKKEFNGFVNAMYDFYYPDAEGIDDDDFVDGTGALDIFRPDTAHNATKYLSDIQDLITQHITNNDTLNSRHDAGTGTRTKANMSVPITVSVDGIEERTNLGVTGGSIDTLIIKIEPRQTEEELVLTPYDFSDRPGNGGIDSDPNRTTGSVTMTDAKITSDLIVEVLEGIEDENADHTETTGYTYQEIVEQIISELESAISAASFSDLGITVDYSQSDLDAITPDGASSKVDLGETHSITFTATLTPGADLTTGTANNVGESVQYTLPTNLMTQSFEIIIKNTIGN